MCKAKQSKLQFLDMVVISDQTKQHYYTNIYHKPTDTGLYSIYNSNVPAEYKLGKICRASGPNAGHDRILAT